MRKGLIILLAIIACITMIGAERKEQTYDNSIDFEGQGFQKMKATAYCMGHHTANGDAVYTGGCAASSEHLGDVAIIYTAKGEYLGMYYCNDTGGQPIEDGYVIDLYRKNLTQCQMFMRLIAPSDYTVWVKYVKGNG